MNTTAKRRPAIRSGKSRALRALGTITAIVALIVAAVGLVFRVQPVTTIPRLMLAVGSTFVPLIALTGLVLAIMSRRVLLSLLGVFLLTATVAIQVNWYYLGRHSDIGAYKELRVLSSNLRYGRADPTEFVGLANSSADVITVAELTEEAVTRFTDAGIGQSFPHSQLTPGSGASGIGMWSRYPLTPVSAPRHRSVSMPAARVQVPGLEHPPLLASVHVQSPVSDNENTIEDWNYGMAGAKAQLANFATAAGPAAVIIGGDYNSTPDMRQFRDLLTNGYQDAVEELGAGYAPTFKADSWLPPVITIDHVLTRNATPASVKTVKIKGSDHRALLATIRIPLNPAPA